jgi:hypothetical protein
MKSSKGKYLLKVLKTLDLTSAEDKESHLITSRRTSDSTSRRDTLDPFGTTHPLMKLFLGGGCRQLSGKLPQSLGLSIKAPQVKLH